MQISSENTFSNEKMDDSLSVATETVRTFTPPDYDPTDDVWFPRPDVQGELVVETNDNSNGTDTANGSLIVSIDAITGDDVVDAAEQNASDSVTITGSFETAGGFSLLENTLTLSLITNEITLDEPETFAVQITGNTFTASIPASAASIGTNSINVSGVGVDANGMQFTFNETREFKLEDARITTPHISINAITQDDFIDADEQQQDTILVTGVVSGHLDHDLVHSASTVTFVVDGQSYEATVEPWPLGISWSGLGWEPTWGTYSFSAEIPADVLANATEISATVNVIDGAGNTAENTTVHTYEVESTDPVYDWGTWGDDALTGNGGNDFLYGGWGDDTLTGNNGNDTLMGSFGDDVLIGGKGADILRGGFGNDVFVFNTLADSRVDNTDTIADFRASSDKIDVSGIDANALLDGDQAFTWADEFSNNAGELIFADGKLQGDVDGDGAADFAVTVNSSSWFSPAAVTEAAVIL